MKKYCLTIILFALCCAPFKVGAQSGTASFRIISMNMREGGEYASYKAQPYIDFIAKHNPDFVVMQEMDNFTTRNGNKDLLTEIAKGLGMFPYYCKSFTYQGGGFGVAVLSKYPFYAAGRAVSHPSGAREPRACGWVYVQLPDRHVVRIASVHLAVESEELRVKNLAEYNTELFKDSVTPTVFAGDFNALPDSNTLTYAMNRWQNICGTEGFTIPSKNPTSRLDYIMGAPKKWTCSHFEIVPEPTLSDHCFLVADLTYTY